MTAAFQLVHGTESELPTLPPFGHSGSDLDQAHVQLKHFHFSFGTPLAQANFKALNGHHFSVALSNNIALCLYHHEHSRVSSLLSPKDEMETYSFSY